MRKKLLLVGLLLACSGMIARAQAIVAPEIRTSEKIMEGFMDLRFGMFVHWGPVVLKGTEIGWSRGDQVPVEIYDQLYKKFNPLRFKADAWARLAKDAGMKYLVITAKHHDGFCLWPSAYTEYDIASTPFKKDVIGALAKACRKQGIRFCIYYSVLDWHHPDYPYHGPKDSISDPKSDMAGYIVYMKGQLKELITKYHPYMLWFDGNWEKPWTQQDAVEMYEYIKTLDKKVIVNNRLGKGDHMALTANSVGDYATPEQKIGVIDMDHPWESCITIGSQWSWKPGDKIKSPGECLDILAGTAGGNGNLLLNVSPAPDGVIEARVAERLRGMGDWLKRYGDAVYQTRGGPYMPNKIFTATRRGNKINILLLQRPTGILTLPDIPGCKILKAYFMGGDNLAFTRDDKGIHLVLPGTWPDEYCSVIVLETDKETDHIPLVD